MSNPKLVLLGEHPLGSSGNSGMMHALLSNLNIENLDVTCLVAGMPKDPEALMFKTFPIPLVDISEPENLWGHSKLVNILEKGKPIDSLLIVGLDIWRYQEVFKNIIDIRDKRRFRIGAIFPYDVNHIRPDWIEMIRSLDFPCVYSQYGYDILKDHVPHIQYYRPHLHMHDIWKPVTQDQKMILRRNMFRGTGIAEGLFLIGFIGMNQYRKDPQKVLHAFKIFNDKYPNSAVYMHTEKNFGVFNLGQYAMDIGIKMGQLLSKPDNMNYPITHMPNVYNAMDVIVNCSLQEGLSWTVIESYLCGTPVILSDTTAHKELIIDEKLAVPCTIPAYIPVKVASGQSWVDTDACKAEDIAESLFYAYEMEEAKRKDLRIKGRKFGKKWVDGHSDINKLVHDMAGSKQVVKRADRIEAVLFAQHSAAGDVLMTTRCIPSLKERHPDLEFHYMTQPHYMDIVKGNPHIDKVIEWDERYLEKGYYLYCYNPHGDRILPGHWGRNSNSILSDFYWKILRIQPSKFYVSMKRPERIKEKGTYLRFFEEIPNSEILREKMILTNPKKLVVVHTTGGDSHFRRYEYMADVCQYLKDLDFMTVQLGGVDDYPGWADIDLRGKLTFPETNWVMNKARLAITVDSYMSHLAGALGIDQVCLFGSGNYNVVQPKQMDDAYLICMVPDYVTDCKGLGPCSAGVRDCPVTCTGRHDPTDICIAALDILNRNYINPVRQKEGKL